MKIRIKSESLQNAHGSFKQGDVVDWSDNDARPLVETGCAELVTEPVVADTTTDTTDQKASTTKQSSK